MISDLYYFYANIVRFRFGIMRTKIQNIKKRSFSFFKNGTMLYTYGQNVENVVLYRGLFRPQISAYKNRWTKRIKRGIIFRNTVLRTCFTSFANENVVFAN